MTEINVFNISISLHFELLCYSIWHKRHLISRLSNNLCLRWLLSWSLDVKLWYISHRLPHTFVILWLGSIRLKFDDLLTDAMKGGWRCTDWRLTSLLVRDIYRRQECRHNSTCLSHFMRSYMKILTIDNTGAKTLLNILDQESRNFLPAWRVVHGMEVLSQLM